MVYRLEKLISSGEKATKDLGILSNMISNAENVHGILGELFNLENEQNWRANHHILYRRETNKTCEFIVRSDVEIDMNKAKELGFSVKTEKEVPMTGVVKIRLAAATFRTEKGSSSRNRKAIKLQDDRINWIKYKLSSKGECEVYDVNEVGKVMNFMSHKDTANGQVMLEGYDYEVSLKVKDSEGFKKLVENGVGPNKNYGFGMIVCSE